MTGRGARKGAHPAARMKEAAGRLALRRHEMAKLARLAEHPEDLDARLPVYSRKAFLRIAARAAAQGRPGCLVLIDLSGGAGEKAADMAHACQLINRDTRATDIIGRAGDARLALLLHDAGEDGGWRAAGRPGRPGRLACASRSWSWLERWGALRPWRPWPGNSAWFFEIRS